jgi:hypothetical protein
VLFEFELAALAALAAAVLGVLALAFIFRRLFNGKV